MILNSFRLYMPLALLAAVFPLTISAEGPKELDILRIEARRNFDIQASREVLDKLIACAEGSTDKSDSKALAYAALAFAELQRLKYEENDAEPKERRAMGKSIDEAAVVGRAALDNLEESSETFRVRADLFALMIRTDYQGKRYAKKMDKASAMALELDENNPHAHVTASKKLVFAKKSRGGNLPEGLEHLNTAIRLDDTHEMALILRGSAFEKMEDYAAAKADWTRAVQLNPKCNPAIKNLERLADEGH